MSSSIPPTSGYEKHRKDQPVDYDDVKTYLDKFITGLDTRLGITGIVLYGSVARGTAKTDSDINLLFITGDIRGTMEEICRRKNAMAEDFRRFLASTKLHTYINDFVVDGYELKARKPFGLSVANDGIILYDVDNQTQCYLSRLKAESKKKDWLYPDSIF